MAKGAGKKSSKKSKSLQSEPGPGVVSKPENDPIVVDNPNLRIDLLNVDGLPGGGSTLSELKRTFKGLSQLVVFDSDGTKEWRVINLDKNKTVELCLEGGERLVFEMSGSAVRLNTSKTSKFVQDTLAKSRFSLDKNPQRQMTGFVCTGEDVSGPIKEKYDGTKETPLSEKGRHVIVLLPGERFAALQLV